MMLKHFKHNPMNIKQRLTISNIAKMVIIFMKILSKPLKAACSYSFISEILLTIIQGDQSHYKPSF